MATAQIEVPTGHGARPAVTHPHGLHLRLAAHLARVAGGFAECELSVAGDRHTANATSVPDPASLAAEKGRGRVGEANGERAQEAIGAILCSVEAESDTPMFRWGIEALPA